MLVVCVIARMRMRVYGLTAIRDRRTKKQQGEISTWVYPSESPSNSKLVDVNRIPNNTTVANFGTIFIYSAYWSPRI